MIIKRWAKNLYFTIRNMFRKSGFVDTSGLEVLAFRHTLNEDDFYTHTNAEKLEVLRFLKYQLVIQKGLYKPGDTVIFIRKNTLLPDDIAEEFKEYLGKDNRVKEVRLRGELSEGVIIPDRPELGKLGEEISYKLGVKEYQPPLPKNLGGKVFKVKTKPDNASNITKDYRYHKHDVESFKLFQKEFTQDEDILVTEKLHGSQVIGIIFPDGEVIVSSKGLFKQGLAIQPEDANFYWQCFQNTKLLDLLKSHYPNSFIQIYGEGLPIQKGFDYGQKTPTMRVFKLIVNERHVDYSDLPEFVKALYVPIIYHGRLAGFDLERVHEMKEQVSGKELHISEGYVVKPVKQRYTSKGFDLQLKVISKKYKDNDNGIS